MAGGCALRLALHAAEADQQQVAQIPPHAIDTQEAQIVDVQGAGAVGIGNLLRVEFAEPVLRGNARGDVLVEPLERIGGVGTLLHAPVLQPEVVVDDVEVGEELLRLPDLLVFLAVEHVGFQQLETAVAVDHLLDGILNPLHVGRGSLFAGQPFEYPAGQFAGGLPVGGSRRTHGLENGLFDFFSFEIRQVAVSFHDLCKASLSIHLSHGFMQSL